MLLLVAAVASALAVAAPTSAKESRSAIVCGADGCSTITNAELLHELVLTAGETTADNPTPGAYYLLAVKDHDHLFC